MSFEEKGIEMYGCLPYSVSLWRNFETVQLINDPKDLKRKTDKKHFNMGNNILNT